MLITDYSRLRDISLQYFNELPDDFVLSSIGRRLIGTSIGWKRPLEDFLHQLRTGLRSGHANCFFDRYGGYVAHLYTATEYPPAAHSVNESRDTNIHEGFERILYVAAIRGSVLSVARCLKDSSADRARPITYSRVRNGINVDRLWDRQRVLRATELGSRIEDTTVIEWYGTLRDRAIAEMRPIKAMATDPHVSWLTASAFSVANLGRALGQIWESGNGLLVWAWISEPVFESFRAGRQSFLADHEWNCGRTPCLLFARNYGGSLNHLFKEWIGALPPGHHPPVSIALDSELCCLGIKALEISSNEPV